jgi:alkaline phosphatase D
VASRRTPAPDSTPFAHGIGSFDPTAGSVLLWTRVTGGHPLGWSVWRDQAMTGEVAHGEVVPDADRDHVALVDLEGLDPGCTYWYRFELGGVPSPLGRTRTLPVRGSSPVRLGLVSCARYSVAPLTAYRALAARDVDLVVHLGDYIYEDGGDKGPRSHDPDRPVVSLDDYRRRIAQMRTDPDCQALHQRHTVVTLWDDHDLADNAWSGGAKAHDPATQGEWRARVAAAHRARSEWLPARDDRDPERTWRSVALGDVGELLLLDTRIAGRDRHAGDPGTAPVDDPGRSLLGAEQRAWLADRLADTSRPWSLLASSVVVNSLELSLPPLVAAAPLLPNGYAVHDGRVLRDDQWDGYPAERDRVVAGVGQRAASGGRTLILSGDVHSSWAFEGPADATGTPVALEATTPSVSSAPMGRGRLPGVWRFLDGVVRRLPHARWVDITNRGFSVVEVSAERVRVTWWFVDPYDTDDVPDLELGAALRTELAEWPPHWSDDEPVDCTAADRLDLPRRSDDVRRMRRWHQRRRYGRVTGVAAAGAVVGGLLRRRRSGGSR